MFFGKYGDYVNTLINVNDIHTHLLAAPRSNKATLTTTAPNNDKKIINDENNDKLRWEELASILTTHYRPIQPIRRARVSLAPPFTRQLATPLAQYANRRQEVCVMTLLRKIVIVQNDQKGKERCCSKKHRQANRSRIPGDKIHGCSFMRR